MLTKLGTRKGALTEIFGDREYFRELFHFALPIAMQNLIMSSLNLVSVMMVGQMGETAVAAVGLANQIFFLLQLVLFGINSGSAMFTAQLWGKQDIPNIRRVLCLGLILATSVALVFLGLALLAPEAVLGIYSEDPAVVALGSQYLQIFGWSFPFVAISFVFAAVLRSTGNVKLPMVVSISALAFNTIGSYVLIFGTLGFPELGVYGAAISALIARVLECSILVGIVYLRRLPIALRPADFLQLDLSFVGRVFGPMLPVILNETFWSLGISAYYVVYARISTDAIAAMNIVSPLDNMGFVLIAGLANATAIMVGNRIGAGKEEDAFRYGGRSLIIALGASIFIGTQLWLWSDLILGTYKVSPEVIADAQRVLLILGSLYWVRSINAVIVVGILRSGGDTVFSFVLDGVIIWLVGVPCAIFTAFVLDLPVYWVYFSVMSEEFLKCGIGIWRYFSRRWIHNLTHTV